MTSQPTQPLSPQPVPPDTTPPQAVAYASPAGGQVMEIMQAAQKARSGARWFYWISGLSMVNSAILMFGGGITFVVGLGITKVIAVFGIGLAKTHGPQIRYVAFGLEILVALVFVAFGHFADRRRLWAFAVGTALYLLDALLLAYFQDWFSMAFHGLALFGLCAGLRGENRRRRLEAQLTTAEVAQFQPPT